MDAEEQRPTPEQTVDSGSSETRTRAEREAACRAAHPSSRGRDQSGQRAQSAARHYEAAAVHWLATQCAQLGAAPTDDSERQTVVSALGEVAQLVSLRLRRDSEPLNEDYMALVAMLAEVAGRAETRQLLAQDQRALAPLVAVQGALRASWQADPCLARALDSVLAEHSVLGLARTPHDQILLHVLLRRAGIELPCPHLDGLLATSLLADDAMALHLTGPDLLDLSTIILAASDFGAARIALPAGTTAAGLAGVLQEWLLLSMDDEDTGLVGTLLSALTCLDVSGDELAGLARRWLRGWQESDGRVDGAGAKPESARESHSDVRSWAAAVHATTMLAIDSLLLRTHSSLAAPATAAADSGSTDPAPFDFSEAIMAAADWLDAVLPSTHVQGRLWTSEAWMALGDEEEARRQLMRLAEDPHIAFTVLKQSGERAVHLAALVVALGVDNPALADLCDDVAALLTHPEAAQVLLASAHARAVAAEAEPDDGLVRTSDQDALRRQTAQLCEALLRDGPLVNPRSAEGVAQLVLMTRGAQAAVATGDLGWLALLLRGLHRLELAPSRLTHDAAVFLQSQQRPDGAIGPRPAGDCRGYDDRQVRWTLHALPALVEQVRTHQPVAEAGTRPLPDAA